MDSFADLKPYAEYSDDSQAWYGNIPTHWHAMPNRAIFEEVKSQGHEGEPMLSVTISKGIVRQSDLLSETAKKDSSNLDRSKYKLVEPGDIAYNKMRAWQGAFGASQYRGIISPAYVVQRLRGEGPPEFFHHLFRTPIFAKEAERWSYGITSDMWSLRPEHFKAIYVPVPPPAEQAAIVRFLATVDQRVNRFVRAKRRLIELLTEQKQAIITHAVTRGLNPNAKLKPSGIDWLGDVPEHWEMLRLGRVIDLLTGFPFPSSGFSQNEADIPLLRGVNVAPGSLRWEQVVCWPAGGAALRQFELHSGDVVFGMDRPIIASGIRVAVVRDDDLPCYLLQRVCRIRSKAEIDQRYIPLLIASKLFADYLAPIFTGISVPHVSPEQIGGYRIALPPIVEQAELIEHVDGATAHANAAIGVAEREIALIREYRTRLVSDVVTGKLDVRPALVDEITVIQSKPKANIYFQRSVFAAEIIHRLYAEPTFGHVKFEKLIFLCERRCGVNTGSSYHRDAAGPYDNRAIRSIDSQIKKQKWYEARKGEKGYRYASLEKAGRHQSYFDRYFGDVKEKFNEIIETFRPFNTERCEIVATLYSAWEDLLASGSATDDQIVEQVLNHWHSSKKKIEEERWRKALGWMKRRGLTPEI